VRIVRQPLADVVGDVVERIRPGRRPDPGPALAVDVGADGLAVSVQMAGDRRDRPALLLQRLRFHIFLR
jgi:hypothetical protein